MVDGQNVAVPKKKNENGGFEIDLRGRTIAQLPLRGLDSPYKAV